MTNDIKRLKPGEGCHAAVVTAKGRMQGDINVWALPDELLLDFEPGLTATLTERLARFIIADDVEVIDIADQYSLVSVEGPKSPEVIRATGLFEALPARDRTFVRARENDLGEIYLMSRPRCGVSGFDCFVPKAFAENVLSKLTTAAVAVGGRLCGWQALEVARIEAGIPRFGADMDERNLPIECIEGSAVSYNKGCYIGQEILNRVHSFGHVNKSLRGLRLEDGLEVLPDRGAKLVHDGQDAGYITSAVASPRFHANIALAYIRRGVDVIGTELTVQAQGRESKAVAMELPFNPPAFAGAGAGDGSGA